MSRVPSLVEDHERLARFVMQRSWLRADHSVKPDAFMPDPKSADLSVTRHIGLSEAGIWSRGRLVPTGNGRELRGRADLAVEAVRANGLRCDSRPVRGNEQHAEIVGWPDAKEARKDLARELAAAATFTPVASSDGRSTD